jgi:hypothetical protein
MVADPFAQTLAAAIEGAIERAVAARQPAPAPVPSNQITFEGMEVRALLSADLEPNQLYQTTSVSTTVFTSGRIATIRRTGRDSPKSLPRL